MKCKDIREWLTADRSEEDTTQTDVIVATHLKECAQCREFQRRLEEDLLRPLRESEVSPPEEIWLNIKEAIVQTELESPDPRPRLMGDWFMLFRPAFAFAAVALLLTVGLALYRPYRNRQLVYNYLNSQAELMSELSSANNGNGNTSIDFGTSIEEFLL